MTYTRAAAGELRERVAAALGIVGSKKEVERRLPHVGTIHSLCYRLLGGPQMVDGRNGHFKEFCAGSGLAAPPDTHFDPTDMDSPFWWHSVVGRDEATAFRRVIGAARHRMLHPRQILAESEEDLDGDRLMYLAERYDDWCRQNDYLDFEDLLECGGVEHLPVDVILCDEVQDNSKLMWHVVESWAKGKVQLACAGDPFQAIYQFVGADPQLYLDRIHDAGSFVPLGDSYRLTPQAADYAKGIIRGAGWQADCLLDAWHARGSGEAVDGSIFYLARTRALLGPLRKRLLESGEPFTELRGQSPIQTRAAKAFRLITDLAEGEQAHNREFLSALETLPGAALPKGAMVRAKGLQGAIDQARALEVLGVDLLGLRRYLPHSEYLHLVERKYGVAGFVDRPRIALSTIHGAKGLEADHVYLVTSWARLPARALDTPAGDRSEGCVAYVAASRHRKSLHLLHDEPGIPYPYFDD